MEKQIVIYKLDRNYIILEDHLSPMYISVFAKKFENWLDAADKILVSKTPCSIILLFVLGASTLPKCEIKTSLIFPKNQLISLVQYCCFRRFHALSPNVEVPEGKINGQTPVVAIRLCVSSFYLLYMMNLNIHFSFLNDFKVYFISMISKY